MTDRERTLEELVRDFVAHAGRFDYPTELVSRARVILDRPVRIPEVWELYDYRRLVEDRSLGVWGHDESWYVALVDRHHNVMLLECLSQDGHTAEDAIKIGAGRLALDAEYVDLPHVVVHALRRAARDATE